MKKLFPYALAVFFGVLSLWNLWEQDIFWQIRSGLEIFKNAALPTQDTWSYTFPGTTWHNVQWLSSVILAAFYEISGLNGMIALRGLCVFVLFLILAKSVANDKIGKSWVWESEAISLLLLFVAMSFRLQIRSEIFVLILFAGLVLIWFRRVAHREAWTLVFLVLAANFHVGVLPFVMLAALAFLFSDRSWKQSSTWFWGFAFAGSVLINPAPLYSLDFIWSHLFYAEVNQLFNPEHVPVQGAWLTRPEEGLAGWAWMGLAILFFASLLSRPFRQEMKARFQHPLVLILVALIFFGLCFNRTRAIPYFLIFLAPWMILAFRYVSPTPRRILLALAVGVLGVHTALTPLPWGFSLQPNLWPEGSFRFVERERPQKNLYTSFTFGHYQLYAAPDYPVFGDTRETIFRELQDDYKRAYSDPKALNRLLERYKINTIVIKIPGTELDQFGQWRDIIEEYTPKYMWALVYFDDVSVVMLRRTMENESIIKKFEYEFLKPNLPFDNYLRGIGRKPEEDLKFVTEVNRCRTEEPMNLYCALSAAVYAALPGKDESLKAAASILEPMLTRHSKNNDLNIFLKNIYDELGDLAAAEKADLRIEK